MISRYVYDAAALPARELHDLAQYLVMGVRPMNTALHRQEIHDISHQVQRLEFDAIEQLQQLTRFAVSAPQMHVGNPD